MQETWIGYDGKTYQTKKDKLKADLKFIALLSKSGKTLYYGMDGNLYFDEKTNEIKGKCKLKANKSYFAFEIRDKKDINN